MASMRSLSAAIAVVGYACRLPVADSPEAFWQLLAEGRSAITEAPESVSFKTMAERQQALAAVIKKDRDVESLSSFIGVDGANTTLNSGRILINLKPHEERASDISTTIRRLQRETAQISGITPQKCDPRCTRNGQYAYIVHVNGKEFAGISTENFIAALNAEGIPTQASYPPLHELDCFRNGEYRKCLSGAQATEKHDFLHQKFPNTQRAAWETVWIPQFALLGDEEDMNEIASAISKIQRNAKEIAANASEATAEKIAR